VSTVLTEASASQKINWTNSTVFALFHIGAVAALFFFSWKALAITLVLYWMCTGLGISMGYHRLHTHADTPGRTHLLGWHASHPPPEVRSARRSAFAS
jgi:fatty-acid desaturase